MSQINRDSRQKYPKFRKRKPCHITHEYSFYNALCLLFSSCQMFLHLWGFLSPMGYHRWFVGSLWLGNCLYLILGEKKWNKFNLKAFDYTAWSGGNSWHSRASSKRKWQPMWTYASIKKKNNAVRQKEFSSGGIKERESRDRESYERATNGKVRSLCYK